MTAALVDRIAEAVLYEGYILYPYRPSVKNRQRWTFGGLYPPAYCQAAENGDAPALRAECLVEAEAGTRVEVRVRFLHLQGRQVSRLVIPANGHNVVYEPVESLAVEGRAYHTWQEAVEREIAVGSEALADLIRQPRVERFHFAGTRQTESINDATGQPLGMIVRTQQQLDGLVHLSATPAAEGLVKLTIRVENQTPFEATTRLDRDAALLRALVSTHAILQLHGGGFPSLIDPPEQWRAVAEQCRNVGVWPVLVGAEGARDTLLVSPIILYDYPQIAPESPGDFFDGAEIDEMLTLRILTLTEDEKQAMAAVDARTRALLARTETQTSWQTLHGRTTVSPRAKGER